LKPTSKTEAEDPATEPRGGETQWQQSVRMLAMIDRQLEELREKHLAAIQRVAELNGEHHDAERARRYTDAPAIRRQCDDAERTVGSLAHQIAMIETTRRSHAQAVDFWEGRERLRTASASPRP